MSESQIYLGSIPLSSTAGLIDALKEYDTDWVAVKSFSDTVPDQYNSPPDEIDFVSVNLDNGIKALEVYAKDLSITNAPSSIVVGIWVKVGTASPYLLGTFGATAGENRATVLDGAGFNSLSPILMEMLQSNPDDIKVACRVIVDSTRVSYTVDNNAKQSTQSTVLAPNTGFLNTLCVTNSNSAGSAPGIAGTIASYNPTTDAVTIENASFVVDEPLRFPWGSTPFGLYPPLGLSGKVNCVDIDQANNTINIVGSAFDFRHIARRLVRIVPSSATSAPPAFTVQVSTAFLYLLNVSGDVGNQTAQLSLDGITPLIFTNPGTGWLYAFPCRDIDGVTLDSSSRLTVDGNVVNIQNDWIDQPVLVSTAGVAAVVTHTAHGFAADAPVIMHALAMPNGSRQGQKFYVIPVDANSYKLCLVPGGLPVTFGSAGSSVNIRAVGSSTVAAVTLTGGTASVISFGASSTTLGCHWMGAGQRLTLGGTTRPGAAYSYSDLFLSGSVSATAFSVTQQIGGLNLAFETAGSSVTLTAMLQWGKMLIERAFVRVGAVGDTDSRLTIKDTDGDVIDITGVTTSPATIETVNSSVITSGSIQVRPVGGI